MVGVVVAHTRDLCLCVSELRGFFYSKSMSDPTVTPHDSAAPATAPGSAPLPQGTVYYTPGMHAENMVAEDFGPIFPPSYNTQHFWSDSAQGVSAPFSSAGAWPPAPAPAWNEGSPPPAPATPAPFAAPAAALPPNLSGLPGVLPHVPHPKLLGHVRRVPS